MPKIELDKEGNTIYIDDDGQRQTLIERIKSGMTEKHNRLKELEEQKRELDEKLIANSKEQGQIIRISSINRGKGAKQLAKTRPGSVPWPALQ